VTIKKQQEQLQAAMKKFVIRWRLESDLDDLMICEAVEMGLDEVMNLDDEVEFEADFSIEEEDDENWE
jgi:hypothetical protein